MTDGPKITALVGCQADVCAEEVSYPLHLVRMLNGLPICEICYAEAGYIFHRGADDRVTPLWRSLPPVTLRDLSE
jgi:hypothetical protein